MRARTLEQIAAAIDGTLRAADPRAADPRAAVRDVAIDSRTIEGSGEAGGGTLFFALEGARDGHDFIPAALAAGAVAAVVRRERAVPSIPAEFACIEVDSPRAALARLARHVRAEPGAPPAVAITGSVGKTSLCAMLAHLAAPLGAVHRPTASFNNELGVPLTIVGAPDDCALLIAEVGTNAPGEIATLASWVSASVGVITAIEAVHLAGLGTLDGVRREKGALLEALVPAADGSPPTAWVPHAESETLASRVRSAANEVRLRTFGEGGESEVRIVDGERVAWHLDGTVHRFPFPAFPRHRTQLLAAALAVGSTLAIEPEAMLAHVASLSEPPLRGEVRRVGEVDLILDCYNSSPVALRASIERLEHEAAVGRRCCVLATMEELGGESASYHREIGRRLAESPIETVFVAGEGGAWIGDGMQQGGRDAVPILLDDSAAPENDAARTVAAALAPGDRVLFKGSRSARLEEFAARVARFLDEGSTR